MIVVRLVVGDKLCFLWLETNSEFKLLTKHPCLSMSKALSICELATTCSLLNIKDYLIREKLPNDDQMMIF